MGEIVEMVFVELVYFILDRWGKREEGGEKRGEREEGEKEGEGGKGEKGRRNGEKIRRRRIQCFNWFKKKNYYYWMVDKWEEYI